MSLRVYPASTDILHALSGWKAVIQKPRLLDDGQSQVYLLHVGSLLEDKKTSKCEVGHVTRPTQIKAKISALFYPQKSRQIQSLPPSTLSDQVRTHPAFPGFSKAYFCKSTSSMLLQSRVLHSSDDLFKPLN